jgi:hypothetical protein
MIDKITITSIGQLQEAVLQKCMTWKRHVNIQFANLWWSAMSGDGLPTLQFDQLNVITHHLNAMLHNDDTTWNHPTQ